MDYLHYLLIVLTFSSFVFPKPNPTRTRTEQRNFSFAIPAFLLGNGGGIGNVNPNGINNGNLPNFNTNSNADQNTNNVNFGNNLLRQATVTRTVLSTVATVTVQVYRTCTTTAANFLPCGQQQGRRKRSVGGIDVIPASTAAILETTLIDPSKVLDQHLATKNVSVQAAPSSETNGNNSYTTDVPNNTTLYPSEATATNSVEFTDTTLPYLETATSRTPELFADDIDTDQARINLGMGVRTTTIIRTVPVTAIVNSTVTGGANNMLTLTVQFGGCSPPALPLTLSAC